jgi:hypothetical protein
MVIDTDCIGCCKSRSRSRYVIFLFNILQREGAVVVGQIIEHNEQRKHKVIELYNDIKLFLESIIGDNVEKELTTEFGDIVGEIERHQEELKRDECPIVVAGMLGNTVRGYGV